MPELAAALEAASDTKANPASLSRWPIRKSYRFKKHCWPASKIGLTSRRRARSGLPGGSRGCGLNHTGLSSVDETGTTTKMTRLYGRCPKGERLRSKAPFGRWKTLDLHRRPQILRAHRSLRH